MRMVPLGGRVRIIRDSVRVCCVLGPFGAEVSFTIRFVSVSSARLNLQTTCSSPLFFDELLGSGGSIGMVPLGGGVCFIRDSVRVCCILAPFGAEVSFASLSPLLAGICSSSQLSSITHVEIVD